MICLLWIIFSFQPKFTMAAVVFWSVFRSLRRPQSIMVSVQLIVFSWFNISKLLISIWPISCILSTVSHVRFFSFPSHEPRPRGDPDPCAPAFPSIPHHPLSGSISVGSLHTHHNAPCCPRGTTTAAAQLEGKGAHGQQRMWEMRVWKWNEMKRVY